jgi:hypothetical protein
VALDRWQKPGTRGAAGWASEECSCRLILGSGASPRDLLLSMFGLQEGAHFSWIKSPPSELVDWMTSVVPPEVQYDSQPQPARTVIGAVSLAPLLSRKSFGTG